MASELELRFVATRTVFVNGVLLIYEFKNQTKYETIR